MAQLLRSVKSGSEWTTNELVAYNIVVVNQNKEEFFGTIDLPDPAEPIVAGFMTTETWQDAADKTTKKLLQYLDLAMDPQAGHETAVDNFAFEVTERPRLRQWK